MNTCVTGASAANTATTRLWARRRNEGGRPTSAAKDASMKMTERAINAPQGINARRVEAIIMEKMPADTWLTVTQTSRLIRAEESRTRARLNRPGARRQDRAQARLRQSGRGLSVQEAIVSNGPSVGRDGFVVVQFPERVWQIEDHFAFAFLKRIRPSSRAFLFIDPTWR